MGKKVKVKLNSAGIKELLKSAPIVEECTREAEAVKQRAGSGYEVQSRTYPERAGAAVVAVTTEARQQNLKDNTLLKALS